MTPTTLMLVAFAVVGAAAAGVLAAATTSWRSAAEHSRAFWLTWIGGFAALGFAGPATAGLGWAPIAWLAGWCAVGALQPSMVADLLEVRRCTRRRLSAVVARTAVPLAAPPAVRWRAPASPARPTPGALTAH